MKDGRPGRRVSEPDTMRRAQVRARASAVPQDEIARGRQDQVAALTKLFADRVARFREHANADERALVSLCSARSSTSLQSPPRS